MPTNGTMMQCFHWDYPAGGRLWDEVAANAAALAAAGFTALWLPSPCKAMDGARDVGYGIYDLFDLGEFDQKGSVATKYGTRAQLEAAVRARPAGRPAGLPRHRAQPQGRGRRHRGDHRNAGLARQPQHRDRPVAGDRGLDAVHLPRPRQPRIRASSGTGITSMPSTTTSGPASARSSGCATRRSRRRSTRSAATSTT